MVNTNENNNYVYLADVIIDKARELKINTLRKPLWDLKSEITKAVSMGKIKGRVGREVMVDPNDLNEFIRNKKKSLNISENEDELTVEGIKKLIIKLKDAGLSPEEILLVEYAKLGIMQLEGRK